MTLHLKKKNLDDLICNVVLYRDDLTLFCKRKISMDSFFIFLLQMDPKINIKKTMI